MQKRLSRIVVAAIICTIMCVSIVFAATYRLISDKIPGAPAGCFEIRETNDYLYNRAVMAKYYWNKMDYNHFNLTLSNTTQDYYIQTYDLGSDCYGMTAFLTTGEIAMFINEGLIFQENTDPYLRHNAYESVIAHEFGHCFGLDDLGFFDTRDSIMSEYINRASVYMPTSNDYAGVKASYGF